MKLVVTGCNGELGRRVVVAALAAGHTVVGIDIAEVKNLEFSGDPNFTFFNIDLRDYEDTLAVLRARKPQGIVHLAAMRTPGDFVAITHNTNVVISWNVLRSAAELGITRIAQASSVNVVPLVWSQKPKLDYLPLDEDHPCLPDEPYGLSKVICELQADTILRRYPSMRIASLRPTWAVPSRDHANRLQEPERRKNDLWGYVQEDAVADAFLRAVSLEDSSWHGHEAFFITAPDTSQDELSMELKERYWADVPMKEGKTLGGNQSFFDCSKAARLLGWVHRSSQD